MRDFPIFSTETGVSSLTLKEIPYKKQAYIRIQDVQPGTLQEHLRECVQFCKAAGAEHIFAAGHPENFIQEPICQQKSLKDEVRKIDF